MGSIEENCPHLGGLQAVVVSRGFRCPTCEAHLDQAEVERWVRAAEESIISAVRTGDRAAAVAGFALHPLIGSRPLAAALVSSIEADEPSLAALFDAG